MVRFNKSSYLEGRLQEVRLATSRPHILHSKKAAENLVEQETITRLLSGANFLGREEAEPVTKSREFYPCSAGNIRDLKVFFCFEAAVRSGVQCHVTHLTQRTASQDHNTKLYVTIQDGRTSTPKVAGVMIPAIPYKST